MTLDPVLLNLRRIVTYKILLTTTHTHKIDCSEKYLFQTRLFVQALEGVKLKNVQITHYLHGVYFTVINPPPFSIYLFQRDQMVRLFFNIWPFATLKISPKCHKFAEVGSVFCQIGNKLSKICQRLVNFCQSGKISPNLITLIYFNGYCYFY